MPPELRRTVGLANSQLAMCSAVTRRQHRIDCSERRPKNECAFAIRTCPFRFNVGFSGPFTNIEGVMALSAIVGVLDVFEALRYFAFFMW